MLDRNLFRDMSLEVAQARAATLETPGARADFLTRWQMFGPSAGPTEAPMAPEKRMAWNRPKASEGPKSARTKKSTTV